MKFFLVMLNANPGLTIADVQNALGNDIQWYRVANNVWVVHISNTSKWLFDRLSSLATPSGTLLITRLDPKDRQGWMPKQFWDWVTARLPYGS